MMESSKRHSVDSRVSEMADLKKVKIEMEMSLEVQVKEEVAAWNLKTYKIPKKKRDEVLKSEVKEEPKSPQQLIERTLSTTRNSLGPIENQSRNLYLERTPLALSNSKTEIDTMLQKKIEEYELKKKRGTASHMEIEHLKNPRRLKEDLISMQGLTRKRQRLEPITSKEKSLVKMRLEGGERPKGSVDNQALADELKMDFHKVKHQVGRFYEKKFEETGEVVVKERQRRPTITKEQKSKLNRVDRTAPAPPRGSCDRQRIASVVGIRRDQADNHYRKH